MTVAKCEEHPNKVTTERFLENWNLIFPAKSGVEGELERAVLHYGDSAPMSWLWPNRVPCGRVTLIEGPGGSGKSLVALDLVARLAADRPWPDGTPQPQPGSKAVIVCRQDHHADVVGARLQRMGIKPNRLVQFHELEQIMRVRDDGSREIETRPLEFPFDLSALERVVSADSQIKLIVIDPLSDFCGSKKLLAEAIHRLNRLADEKQIAIVVTLRATARFNRQGELVVKSKHDTEAARCQWCCLADPEDPARRLFVPTLMNYARLPKGQAFQPGELAFDWLPGEVDLNDPLRNITPSGKWLKEILKGGPRPAEELKELGKKFGFSAGQLQRAVYEVGGTKDRDNYRKGSKSMWSLQQQLEAAVEAELRAMADAGPLAATAGTENPPLPLGEGRGEGKCPTDPRPENQIPAVQQPAERQRDDERESNDRPHPNPLPEGEGKRLVPSESSSDPSGSPPVAVVKEPAAPVEPKPSVAPVRPVRPLSEQVYIPWDDSPSSRLNPLNAMLDAPQNPNQLRRNVKSVKSNEEMRSRTDAPRESVEGGT